MNIAIALSAVAVFLASLIMPPGARADDPAVYPTKPVRIIVGAPANFIDIVARQLAARLQEQWRQPVVIENRATLMLASAAAAKSAPDGYTLLMSDRSYQAVAQNLFKELPFDPVKDFSPISRLASTPNFLIAHPSIPAASLAELLAYAQKAEPPLHYASAGIGTATHLPGEQLKQLTGVRLTAVHYKGGGAAMAAMVSGEVKIGFNPVAVALPHVKAGTAKALLITSKKRFAGAPDVPTVVEAGLPDLEADYWNGLFAPAGIAPALVAKINRDVVAILESAAMRAFFIEQGAELTPSTPDGFAAFIKSESVKWGHVIRTAGIKPE